MATARQRELEARGLIPAGTAQGQGPGVQGLASSLGQLESEAAEAGADPGSILENIPILGDVLGSRRRSKAIEATQTAAAAGARSFLDVSGLGFEAEGMQEGEEKLLGLLQGQFRAEAEREIVRRQQSGGINVPLEQVRRLGVEQNRFELQQQVAIAGEERSMRDAYHKRISPSVDVLNSVELARNQLLLSSPEAALNSARIFIQQLDKSMITNPELANVIAQQGLSGRLAQFLNWAEGKGSFDQDTRERMVESMASIGQVHQQHIQAISEQTNELASNSSLGINPANVTTMSGFGNRDFDLSIRPESFGDFVPKKTVPGTVTTDEEGVDFDLTGGT